MPLDPAIDDADIELMYIHIEQKWSRYEADLERHRFRQQQAIGPLVAWRAARPACRCGIGSGFVCDDTGDMQRVSASPAAYQL